MKPFVTPDSGQRTADTLKFTNHHLPITKSLHFKPSILAFFVASPQKNIDGKNSGKKYYEQIPSVERKDQEDISWCQEKHTVQDRGTEGGV